LKNLILKKPKGQIIAEFAIVLAALSLVAMAGFSLATFLMVHGFDSQLDRMTNTFVNINAE
jgi:hypothetical protein